MDAETANVAYRLARTFVEWQDLAAEKNPDPMDVSMSWRRLQAEVQKFRLRLKADDHEPGDPLEKEDCEGCPD